MCGEYVSILYKYFFMESIVYIIGFALFLVILIKELMHKQRKKEIIGCVVFLFFIIFGISYNFIAIRLDISNNSVITASYTTGDYHPEGEAHIFVKPYWFRINDDLTEELSVVTDIPQNLENGTVVYSKRSKVLLDYTGSEVAL